MSVRATDHLRRLLAMVPWLLNHQGVPLAEAAGHFGVSEDQLVQDLELLFVCGTPGHMPDDLIEADWDSGRVYLDNAEAISRPLRLAPDEAIVLIAALRTLADLPGGRAERAVTSALAKLSAAAQDAVDVASRLDIDLGAELSAEQSRATLRTLRDALDTHRRLRLDYVVPTRDETTERDVDPMRILTVSGRWYLEAWCHRADGVRLFRLDRMTRVQVLDADGTPPAEATPRDADSGRLFTPAPQDVAVTLDVEPNGRWVAEYYPVEETTELGEGRQRIVLRVADPRWIPRLVLRLGGAATVVAPAGLVTETVDLARQALDAYGS